MGTVSSIAVSKPEPFQVSPFFLSLIWVFGHGVSTLYCRHQLPLNEAIRDPVYTEGKVQWCAGGPLELVELADRMTRCTASHASSHQM